MYNEEAHGALVVERVCAMAWPRSRVLFQVRLTLRPPKVPLIPFATPGHRARC